MPAAVLSFVSAGTGGASLVEYVTQGQSSPSAWSSWISGPSTITPYRSPSACPSSRSGVAVTPRRHAPAHSTSSTSRHVRDAARCVSSAMTSEGKNHAGSPRAVSVCTLATMTRTPRAGTGNPRHTTPTARSNCISVDTACATSSRRCATTSTRPPLSATSAAMLEKVTVLPPPVGSR